jgi:hypothetical protein
LQEYGDIDAGRLADVRYAVSARDGLWALAEMACGKVSDDYPRIAAHHFKLIAEMA